VVGRKLADGRLGGGRRLSKRQPRPSRGSEQQLLGPPLEPMFEALVEFDIVRVYSGGGDRWSTPCSARVV
jgi:hypothetical protein